MGEFLSNLSADQKGQLVTQALKLAPAIISFGQSRKARNQQREYLDDIKKLEKNRQQVRNPYENLSNPYANLGVATKAAEMQAEQADMALANTLDSLRQTGGGGATALAQAALRSKQGVSASIQKQEAQNQRLIAQGEREREMAVARGESIRFARQEERDNIQLDRLQALADEAGGRRQEGFGTGIDSLTSMAGGIANALINPKAQGSGSDFDAMKIANSLTDPSSIGQGLQGSFSGNTASTSFNTSNMSLLNPNSTGGAFDVSNLNISLSNP